MHIVGMQLIDLRLAAALRANNSVRFDNALCDTVIDGAGNRRQAERPMSFDICGIVACLFLCI